MKDRKYTLAGGARRLHGLRALRGGLPGEEQERSQAQGHQHGAAAAAARSRSRELGFLPDHSRDRPQAALARPGEGHPAAAAAVRILRRLLGMRRDALPEADDPALRRPRDDRQRDRLLARSTAATCRPRLTARTKKAADLRGATRCSRTTRSSALGSAPRGGQAERVRHANWCGGSASRSAKNWRRPSSTPTRRPSRACSLSASASRS